MPQNETVTIQIKGMSCNHCTKFIETTINELDGIVSKEVNLEQANAVVQYDAQVIAQSAIVDAIKDTHFDVISYQ